MASSWQSKGYQTYPPTINNNKTQHNIWDNCFQLLNYRWCRDGNLVRRKTKEVKSTFTLAFCLGAFQTTAQGGRTQAKAGEIKTKHVGCPRGWSQQGRVLERRKTHREETQEPMQGLPESLAAKRAAHMQSEPPRPTEKQVLVSCVLTEIPEVTKWGRHWYSQRP